MLSTDIVSAWPGTRGSPTSPIFYTEASNIDG
jgi:hypothetical protein